MKKYKVTIARVEHSVFYFNVNAENEEQAEELANELFDDVDLGTGEVVHGESFINGCEEITGDDK
jgi:hypothetical protein